jgi:hypothetical protein
MFKRGFIAGDECAMRAQQCEFFGNRKSDTLRASANNCVLTFQ